MKVITVALLSILSLAYISSSEIHFHSNELKEAYENVRDVLEKPLYNIDQIESDFKNVEEFLKDSRVTSFIIGYKHFAIEENEYFPECEIPMTWDGELKFLESYKGYVSIHRGTNEIKYKCHKQLPKLLKAAKKEMEKEKNKNKLAS